MKRLRTPDTIPCTNDDTYYDYRINMDPLRRDAYTRRRIKDKLSSIESLACMVENLEQQLKKHKKEHDNAMIAYKIMRTEVAHTMNFYSEYDELAMRMSVEVPLFRDRDTLYVIISHLFKKPLRFDTGQAVLDYRPSYANQAALRDLCHLTQTCRYMNDIIGPVLRKNRPIVASHCVDCKDPVVRCDRCKTSYCYTCDHDGYPRYQCQRKSCRQVNLMCVCYRETTEAHRVHCCNCATQIDRSLFT